MRRYRGIRLCLFAALLVLSSFLVGCLSKVNKDNFDKIKTGMTEADVKDILGGPTESKGVNVAIVSGTNSTWKGPDGTITIQFVNGKVFAKEFSKTDQ